MSTDNFRRGSAVVAQATAGAAGEVAAATATFTFSHPKICRNLAIFTKTLSKTLLSERM